MNDEPTKRCLLAHARFSSVTAEDPDDMSSDEFEVTIQSDDDGDPDRFHIASISPRPRR